MRRRSHHHIVPAGGGFRPAANPIHQRRSGSQSALADFAPADQPLTARVHNFFDATDEIALKFVTAFQAFGLHARLASGTVLPARFWHLIPANVDEFSRKQFGDLRQDIPQKGERLVVAGAINAVVIRACCREGVFLRFAGKLRICRDRRRGMAGHLDFRNHRDVARRCVGDNLPDVGLRVISSVASEMVVGGRRFRIEIKADALAPRADLRQFRVFIDLDPPALVIGEMPVKRVELVERHPVQNRFYLVLRKKMTTHIEHESTPGESRRIGNLNARNCPGDPPRPASRKKSLAAAVARATGCHKRFPPPSRRAQPLRRERPTVRNLPRQGGNLPLPF